MPEMIEEELKTTNRLCLLYLTAVLLNLTVLIYDVSVNRKDFAIFQAFLLAATGSALYINLCRRKDLLDIQKKYKNQ